MCGPIPDPGNISIPPNPRTKGDHSRRYEHGGSTAGTAVFSGYFDLPVERGKEDIDARAPVDKKNAHSDSAVLLAPNRSSSMWFESSVLLE